LVWIKSFFSQQDEFKKAISLSAFLHIFLVMAMIFKANFKQKPLIDVSQAITVSLADITPNTKIADEPQQAAAPAAAPEPVAMIEQPEPEVSKKSEPEVQEKTKPEPADKKVEKTKPKEDINLAKVKSKQKLALEKIKKMSALEKIREQVSKEAANAKKTAKGKSRTIAAGTALTGLDKIDASQYLLLLDYNIKQVWTLPQWLMNKNLQAQVLVKFTTAGKILSTQIIKSSGNATYDSYCMQAVTKASPFPKVPEKFSEKFSIDGLVIGFPE
jgi:TonB family protein